MDPGQILSGFQKATKILEPREVAGRNFILLGGVQEHAPLENFENQVSQIGGNWISDYLF